MVEVVVGVTITATEDMVVEAVEEVDECREQVGVVVEVEVGEEVVIREEVTAREEGKVSDTE